MNTIAKYIIPEMNKRIASIFRTEVKTIDVKFVPLIERREVLEGNAVHTTEKLGTCNTQTGEIKIVPTNNWGVTLIEELVHLYNPDMRHPQVKNCVRQCVRYLKLTEDKRRNEACWGGV